ncbi:MAG: sulfotransferase domain-containing protein [Pseudomonadota bacterium]
MQDRKLYLGPLTDNRRWDQIQIRPDDVIVVTPPKSGTTWMQTIIALLLSGDPDVEPDLSEQMPWVDIRFRPIEDLAARLGAMTGRRCLKSHTPLDGLPIKDQAHYLCVFRHPLDVHFSFRHHNRNLSMTFFDHWFPEDDTTGIAFGHFLAGGPEGFDADAAPLAHILRHYQTAKALSGRPNVSLFHYADMKRDLPGTFARIADLLGVSHPALVMERLVQSATFDHMKTHADRYVPFSNTASFGVQSDFFHAGTNGQWQGRLTDEETAAYDAMMDAQLSPKDRAWLETGSESDPDV